VVGGSGTLARRLGWSEAAIEDAAAIASELVVVDATDAAVGTTAA